MLKKVKEFVWEKSSQGALEYIMLVGGIISVAVIVAVIYTRSVREAANETEKTISNVSKQISQVVKNLSERYLSNIS